MMALLKAAHFAGLLVWCAGLFYMPGLLLQKRPEDEVEAARIAFASRFTLAAVLSPAAFVTIGSGTALLFVADALHGWMFLKLAFVSVMIYTTIRIAWVLRELEEEDRPPNRTLLSATVGLSAIAILAVIYLVLAEPSVPTDWLPSVFSTPGGLSDLLSRANPT
jgi:uncharacterized membrane protein